MTTAYERVRQKVDVMFGVSKWAEARHAMEVARRMIAKDKPVDEIVEFTGLTVDDVLRLQSEA